jgi:hypothetical protein
MNGIWLKKNVKIANPQELWNPQYNVRGIYTDLTDNGALRSVANDCAFYGFSLGLYHRLRYPPESGSADSQAQEFMVAEQSLMNVPDYKAVKWLPPVLHLEKGVPVLCETGMYREMIMTFLTKYRSYHGVSAGFYLKMTDDMIFWLNPTQPIVDSFKLFYHEPTRVMNYSPWKSYVYRSYAPRSMAGTMAEPFDDVQLPLTVPVTPPVTKLTAEQKIEAIQKILNS